VEELQKAKASLEAETAEQRRELEVSENDKTVLRDALKQVEEEKNGLALDLAETSKVGQQIFKMINIEKRFATFL
jgi:predicted  nucleic acid-binding Zn-ribbon protein